MKKMECYILDDEPPAIRIIEKYLEEIPFVELTGKETDPLLALAQLQNKATDLIFLDINMPQLSGMDFLRSLPHPPMVIFTTAYPEFAVEGFELEAVDYLVKPIAKERFLKAVNRAYRQFSGALATNSPEPNHLLIKADRKLHRIPVNKILFLQAYGDYVKVICSNQTFLPKEKLANLLKKLPTQTFFKVHRSFVVNLNHIAYIEGNHLKIEKHIIPISAAHKNELLEKMN